LTLAGRVALVTGASRGIGVAITPPTRGRRRRGARRPHARRRIGARLAGSLAETVALVEADGGRAAPIVANLADPDDRARIVPAARAALGPIDVLVHNAAAAIYAPVGEMPLRRRQAVFEVNVHAALDLAQAVLPDMRAAGRGSIVNLSSVTAAYPAPPPATTVPSTMSIFGASKAALERLTIGLAAEVYADRRQRSPPSRRSRRRAWKRQPPRRAPRSWGRVAEATAYLAACGARAPAALPRPVPRRDRLEARV
jgi:NAD(P)-dependent dehydrogenase (short-subunit alcohol dehydrogenase family)